MVLEQSGCAIAYASSNLSKAKCNYGVIQRECLVIVEAFKQLCNYLLVQHFFLLTDHAPLQWLSAQKMKGMLARLSLAMQEHDYTIMY